MRIIILMLMLLITSPALAVQWDKLLPATTDTRVSWPTQNQGNNESIDRLLSNYREGITLSYSSTSAVSVSAGEIMVSNAGGTIRLMLKNAAAESVGWSSLDTGTEATATQYYVYAYSDAAATAPSFKISASSSAPSGVTYYKRIGSFYNDSSGNITQVVNDNAEGISYGLDYGTSTSSYVIKNSGLKVAYGQASWSSGGTTTVSGLPFSSASSYKVVAAPVDAGSTNTWPPNVSQSSGSSFTIGSSTSGSTTANWIAIGI